MPASSDSNLLGCTFPTLMASRRISFKQRSDALDSHDFGGIYVSPATHIFQSDFCKSVVGSRVTHSVSVSPVSLQVPCANSCTMIGSPVAIAFTNSVDQHNDAACDGAVSASSMSCRAGLNHEGIGCYPNVAGSIPDESTHVQHGISDDLAYGVELMPGNRLCVPSWGEHLRGDDRNSVPVVFSHDSEESESKQHNFPSQRSVDVVPNSASEFGLPIGDAGCPNGITWSSVVEKNSLGDVFTKILSSKCVQYFEYNFVPPFEVLQQGLMRWLKQFSCTYEAD